MQAPRIPDDETERQAALERTGLLGSGPSTDLQDIVELAATICAAPMALLSLIDRHRQIHKARIGVNPAELPRALSVCGHTILGSEPLVIADATKDQRFADNPLVARPPHIRFYAGIPLRVASGQALGALCILDTRPRQIEDVERASLQRLARIARIHLQHWYDQGGTTP